jgi:hypothetical protein
VVVVGAILAVTNMEPNELKFIMAFALILMTVRVMWILYQDFCQNLLLGHDLNASLHITKTSWSINEIELVKQIKSAVWGSSGSVKIYSVNADEAAVNKKLAKFAKLRKEAELLKEIARVKEAVFDMKAELTCLENMRFAFDQSSSDGSNRHSSHAGASAANESEGSLNKWENEEGTMMTAYSDTSSAGRQLSVSTATKMVNVAEESSNV